MQHTLFFAGDSKTVDEAVKGDEQIEGDHEEENGKMLMFTYCYLVYVAYATYLVNVVYAV